MQAKRHWYTVFRAFWQALQMTLRGQTYTPAPPTYPELRDWIKTAQSLLNVVFQAADAQGLDEAARKQRFLPLDGRPMSMQTLLSAIDHNLAREYPLLLNSGLEHSFLTLIAFNLNDRYRLTELANSLVEISDLRAILLTLEAHLAALPRPMSKTE